MAALRQPFRAVLGLTNLLQRLGVGASPASAVDVPAAERQLSGPPFWMTRKGDPAVTTYDHVLVGRGGPVTVRVYTPPDLVPGAPAIVYLHGGGFVMGGLNGCDYITRGLASRTGFAVFSVEYRLAPDCPYPGPLEDCEDALLWVASTCPEGIDPTRIAVAGDSAGGNLAAALALLTRDNGGPAIAHQTLIYPFTDGSISSADWDTYQGGGIDRSAGLQMMAAYAPNHAADFKYVSVLDHPSLSDLPPALVITAEHDVLHADGIAYATRLLDSGVPVVTHEFEGVPHGFVTMPRLTKEADRALDLVASETTKALRQPAGHL